MVVLGNVLWRGFRLILKKKNVGAGCGCCLDIFLSSSISQLEIDNISTNKIIKGSISPSVVKIREIFYREVSLRSFHYIVVILFRHRLQY